MNALLEYFTQILSYMLLVCNNFTKEHVDQMGADLDLKEGSGILTSMYNYCHFACGM